MRWAALLLAVLLQAAALCLLLRPTPPIHPALAEGWIQRLDTDGDGVLSAAESAALSPPGLPTWDLDGDGVVSPGELERMLWTLDPNLLFTTVLEEP